MLINEVNKLTFDMIADIYGDDLTITYRPMAIRCNDQMPEGNADGLVQLVVKMVADWGLYEEDKITKVPITFERLHGEPVQFFNMIIFQITNHNDRRLAKSAQNAGDPRGPEFTALTLSSDQLTED